MSLLKDDEMPYGSVVDLFLNGAKTSFRTKCDKDKAHVFSHHTTHANMVIGGQDVEIVES